MGVSSLRLLPASIIAAPTPFVPPVGVLVLMSVLLVIGIAGGVLLVELR